MKCNECQNEDICCDGNHELTRLGCAENHWCCFVPITNGDRLRRMTDEELALFLSDHEFALFGMWAKPNFILEFLQSDDWDGFMRSAEKGWEEYTTSPVETDE